MNNSDESVAHVPSRPCWLCGATRARLCETVRSRPQGEVDYGVAPEKYLRRIYRCEECQVFFNDHEPLPDGFYSGHYNESSYGAQFRARFDKIMALPLEQSDNKQRAQRLHEFMQQRGQLPEQTKVLDVGSGLGVFPAEIRRFGYLIHAIDPDPRSVEHMRSVGIERTWVGSVEAVPSDEVFDLITLNKVLEHVETPLKMLQRLGRSLSERGVVYIELPDGEAAAAAEGFVARQEFFMSHWTVFGPSSLRWLAEHAGLRVIEMQRIHEPSDKYTIYALAEPAR